MKVQKLKTLRTAHVYEHGDWNKDVKHLWIVAHGYGQTAERIIKKFDVLGSDHFIIAPEGLNKFYWHDEKRTHSATWMTSRHRLDEISDYCDYLDQVLEIYGAKVESPPILLGFSQGASTIYRWLKARNPSIKMLINWAGWIPDDIDLSTLSEKLDDDNHHMIYGLQDEFLTADRLKVLKGLYLKNQITPTFHTFEGSHRIPRKELSDLVNVINI